MTKPKSPGRPPIHSEAKVTVTVQITRATHEALQAEAISQGISKNELLETILRDALNLVDKSRFT